MTLPAWGDAREYVYLAIKAFSRGGGDAEIIMPLLAESVQPSLSVTVREAVYVPSNA